MLYCIFSLRIKQHHVTAECRCDSAIFTFLSGFSRFFSFSPGMFLDPFLGFKGF